jgi:GNAT superfamily N-acetyltransferase
MRSGELVEWVAVDTEGKIIATAAILFMDFPPAFDNPAGIRGYITNMYTDDRFRGQGIAGVLLKKLEQEAEDRGVRKLTLHASALGRKAYIKSGYCETDVLMEKVL